MKKYLNVILLFGIFTSAQEKVEIWPKNQMANTKGMQLERIETNERITQVQAPEMLTYFPAKETNNKKAILILPGGGYRHLTYNLGGIQFAKWFNAMGISAFVLNYRLPTSPDLKERNLAPLQDAQMAIKFLRKNATAYEIDPQKIGVFGTSAGGHLATLLSNSDDQTQLSNDWKDYSVKPNFCMVISPVIDFVNFPHPGSVENLLGQHASENLKIKYSTQHLVSSSTPPTLLVHAQNDKSVSVENSILYYQALNKYKIKSLLYISPDGNHNINLLNDQDLTSKWKDILVEWLKQF